VISERRDDGAIHIQFTRSETLFRLHYPPRRGDFAGAKYFTGTRWVRRSAKGRRRAQS
jgi:hypothetical protein